MRRPPVIALIGVDGSGKTTQARALTRWLNAQGTPARYFENAGGRPILDGLAHRLGYPSGRELLGHGYVVVEAAVRWIAVGRALLMSWLTGRIAVMDRYAYCQYAVMRARADGGERWVRLVFSRFSAPDLVCLLAVPARIAQKRVELRGYDREELAYLIAFDEAYRSLPEAASFRIVDASGSPEHVRELIQKEIAPFLPPPRPARSTK